jgi:hypothetical protein
VDVTFQPDEHRWSGTWILDGETQRVVLESPHPAPGSQPNVLCGDWEAIPDSTVRSGFTGFHIAQSSDGTLTAWGDQTFVAGDQRHGVQVDIKSRDLSDFIIEMVTGVCCPGRFEGAFSSDGSRLSGNWTSLNARQPVPQTFRRIASPACSEP